MVDLMSHVFSPRDIQEKWVGHVDFQLPSKRQKPSGKPPSSNKGLKNGCNAKKIAQPFSSFLSFGTPTIDAKTGLPIKYPSVERNRQNGSDQIRTFGHHFANHFITGATTRPK